LSFQKHIQFEEASVRMSSGVNAKRIRDDSALSMKLNAAGDRAKDSDSTSKGGK
jgi:hypothetical protein